MNESRGELVGLGEKVMVVPLVFQILDETDFRSQSTPSSVSDAESARIIHRSENFGLWLLDIEAGQVHWCERAFEIFGIKNGKNPVNFKDVAACYHPDDIGVRLELIEMAAKNRSGYHMILRIKDGDGGYKLIRSIARFKMDRENRPVLYGMVHHIGPIEYKAVSQ